MGIAPDAGGKFTNLMATGLSMIVRLKEKVSEIVIAASHMSPTLE